MNDNKFLQEFALKVGLSSKDVADYFGIKERTLYNYNQQEFSDLPNKIKGTLTRILAIFAGFDPDGLSDKEIKEFLATIPPSKLLGLKKHIRQNNVLSKAALLERESDTKPKVGSAIKRIVEQKMNSNISEGFLSSLVELLDEKLSDGNDYGLLDYISKYEK